VKRNPPCGLRESLMGFASAQPILRAFRDHALTWRMIFSENRHTRTDQVQGLSWPSRYPCRGVRTKSQL
jgi:hypothetical protein